MSLFSSQPKPNPDKITQSLPVPSLFGKYKVLEHIGRGGMGDVYKAEHIELGRKVALKILPAELTTPEAVDRFNAEAQAISRLQHQNIVTLYEFGSLEMRKYISMQLIQGENLSDLLHRHKRLDPQMVVHIGKQICRALFYAHSQGVIHRDVKTSNIMVEGEKKAYLSDFGIAQVLGATRLTTTGMAMGTPEYMSPEQCEGKQLDHLCDIYGLGIVFFEMLTGIPPFSGENALAIAYKQVHEVPRLVSKVRPEVPPRFDLIIAKCLKKNKAERYTGADQLLADLDTVFQITEPTTPAATPRVSPQAASQRNRRHTDPKSPTQAISKIQGNFYFWVLAFFVVFSLLLVSLLAWRIHTGKNNPWHKPSEIWWQESGNKPILTSLPLVLDTKNNSLLLSFPQPILAQSIRISLASQSKTLKTPLKLSLSLHPQSQPITLTLTQPTQDFLIPLPSGLAWPTLQHIPVRLHLENSNVPVQINSLHVFSWKEHVSP